MLRLFRRRQYLEGLYRTGARSISRPIAAQIAQAARRIGGSVLVGLCGSQGSGKSTAAAVLKALLEADRLPYTQSRTAIMVADIIDQVRQILSDEPRANMILARGFARHPSLPKFADRYQMRPAAVAGYPMYRGVAKLLGIPVVSKATTAADICQEVVTALKDYNFIYAHFKYTDKAGEDGNLAGKVQRIEEMDAALPTLLAASPDVLIITGDHSTPPGLKGHSWHPVPVLMSAPYLRGGDGMPFDEVSCRKGQIGTIPAKELLPLAMAHAGKLEKFGA